MLQDKEIAVFIDVDNAVLDNKNYNKVMEQIEEMGEIVCGTLYGASERKHKKVIEAARDNGYIIQLPMRNRRRVRKVFDDRIFIDVSTLIAHNHDIDAVAIISGATDLVYLFSFLRRYGIAVITGNNLDEQSTALANEVVDLGKPEKKPAKPKAPKAAPAKAKPQEATPDEDRMAAILREINKLQAENEAAQKKAEEKTTVQPAAEQPQSDIMAETQSLMDKVASYNDAPKEAPAEAEAPRASYVSQNDADLIRKIEELRKNKEGSDDDVTMDIKKLLDELE